MAVYLLLSPNYATLDHGNKCKIKDYNIPSKTPLYPGGKAMLLTNFVFKQNMFNKSVGNLKFMHFSGPSGPFAEILRGYIVVDFPCSMISEYKKLIPGTPRTCVHVLIVGVRCNNSCCGIKKCPYTYQPLSLTIRVKT